MVKQILNSYIFKGVIKTLKEIKAYLFWTLHKPKIPTNKDGKTYVHVGCGKSNIPGFINIDARPLPHVHVVLKDLKNFKAFANDSVDLIYTSHTLEHIKRKDIVSVLGELKRILKENGILRMSVPDFDKIIKLYREGSNDIQAIEKCLMGGQENEYNVHYLVLNEKHLTELLKKAGFKEVRKWNADNYGFNDWSREKKISLNLEGIK